MKKNLIIKNTRFRLSIFKSHQNIYAQVINDSTASTVISCSTLDSEIRGKIKNGRTCAAAHLVGLTLGKRLIGNLITTVVVDKGYKPYHGRIKALADGVRKAGLNL
uniref:ribosomal protein L18 n=1 Tax=Haramonas pauciplastida TaxID=478668 RepID=UPI002114E973|nr:ribosomal protein L18 [Haramonas pauciplastida]UTE94966.1 ribosomal protein L18 [Haramonas pauciplastida]